MISTPAAEEERPKESQIENRDLLPEISLVVKEEAEDDEDRVKAEYMEARERMAREIIAMEMKEKLAKEAMVAKEKELKKEVMPRKRVVLEKVVKENISENDTREQLVPAASVAKFISSLEDPEEEVAGTDEDIVAKEPEPQTTAVKREPLDIEENSEERADEEKAQTSKASPRDSTEQQSDFDNVHLEEDMEMEARRPDYKESRVAKELAVLLSNVKDQYMMMLTRMQAPSYSLRIQGEVQNRECFCVFIHVLVHATKFVFQRSLLMQISVQLREELGRRNQLTKRVTQLQGQVCGSIDIPSYLLGM